MNAFSIMALNSLLIEALCQYYEGVPDYNDGVITPYSNFLRVIFGSEFKSDREAKDFYKFIRCGLLHAGQTVNQAQITIGNSQTIETIVYEEGPFLTVSADLFTYDLKDFFRNYVRDLRHSITSDGIRLHNLIVRMLFLACKRSEIGELDRVLQMTDERYYKYGYGKNIRRPI